MSIGIWQIVLILLIVVMIFGAGKLPQVMGDLAKSVKSFKAGMKDIDAPTVQKDTPVASPPVAAPATKRDEQASS